MCLVFERGDADLEERLHQFESRGKTIPVRAFWFQLVRAVSALHAEEFIRGNLKPSSFSSVDGKFKVIDLGLESPVADDKSLTPHVSYAPPERLHDQGISLTFESDVWSLGALLFRMVTGKPLFSECRNNQARKIMITLGKEPIPLPQHIGEDLRDLLNMCLRRDQETRASLQDIMNHPFTKAGAAEDVV